MDAYETAFGLILHAGNSRSKSMMTIEEARDYHFEEAEKLIGEAKEELYLAHQTQTSLIQNEASGDKVEVNIIMVHAQDHLTMTMLMTDHAEEFLNLYRILSKVIQIVSSDLTYEKLSQKKKAQMNLENSRYFSLR